MIPLAVARPNRPEKEDFRYRLRAFQNDFLSVLKSSFGVTILIMGIELSRKAAGEQTEAIPFGRLETITASRLAAQGSGDQRDMPWRGRGPAGTILRIYSPAPGYLGSEESPLPSCQVAGNS